VEKRENIKGEGMGRTLLGVSFWAFPLLLDQKSIGTAVNDFCGSFYYGKVCSLLGESEMKRARLQYNLLLRNLYFS